MRLLVATHYNSRTKKAGRAARRARMIGLACDLVKGMTPAEQEVYCLAYRECRSVALDMIEDRGYPRSLNWWLACYDDGAASS